MSIAKNYEGILEEIHVNQGKSKYKQSVGLIGVTKTIDPSLIIEAIELGVENIAENRVQEIRRKYEEVTSSKEFNWHLIGSLQTNKVKYIIDKVAMIHSLDRYDLAKEIDRQAEKIGKIQDCLVQVKLSEEDSKKGADIQEAIELIKVIQKDFSNIRICGLMGMAPYVENIEESRKYFSELKQLFDKIVEEGIADSSFCHLSMGMSNDFPVAIQEGATLVRIGSALFENDNNA